MCEIRHTITSYRIVMTTGSLCFISSTEVQLLIHRVLNWLVQDKSGLVREAGCSRHMNMCSLYCKWLYMMQCSGCSFLAA